MKRIEKANMLRCWQIQVCKQTKLYATLFFTLRLRTHLLPSTFDRKCEAASASTRAVSSVEKWPGWPGWPQESLRLEFIHLLGVLEHVLICTMCLDPKSLVQYENGT